MTTFEPLQESSSAQEESAQLSLWAHLPAKTSHAPTSKAGASTENDLVSSSRPSELSGKSGPFGDALRTLLTQELEERTGFVLRWKRSATPSGRSWWVLGTPGHRTDGTASGSSLLPTPVKSDAALAGSRDYQSPNRNPGQTLSDLWLGYLPTPRASDGDRGGRGDLIQAMRGNSNSHFKAPMLPTPTKRDQRADNWSPAYERRKSPTIDALSSRHGRTGIHALLELVEWMMGYPPSWHASGSEPTATPLSHKSPKRSGEP